MSMNKHINYYNFFWGSTLYYSGGEYLKIWPKVVGCAVCFWSVSVVHYGF